MPHSQTLLSVTGKMSCASFKDGDGYNNRVENLITAANSDIGKRTIQ
jgi:hypothetical protein